MVTKRVFLAWVIIALGFALILFSSLSGTSVLSARDVSAPFTSSKIYLPYVSANVTPIATAPLWRFGIGKARRPLWDYRAEDVAAMRFGWYVDWRADPNTPQPYGIEHVPILRVKQWKDQGNSTWTTWCVGCPYAVTATGDYTYTLSLDPNQIRSVALTHPGALWLIGNEIERRDWNVGSQDEIVPELYAQAYHQVYSTIKSADPLAQVAVGGLIEATPLRLQYLDQVWNAYQTTFSETMPVDVWNIHAFVLQEKSCAAFPGDCWGAEIPAGLPDQQGMLYSWLDNRDFTPAKEQIIAMRTWMKNHNQQNKPLIISEYGVNFPDWVSPGSFTPEIVRDRYMYPSFNYFLNQPDSNLGYAADGYRMVQRWNWYSLDDDNEYSNGDPIYNGNLFYSGWGSHPQGFATLGTYWRQYVQSLPPGPNPPYIQPISAPIVRRPDLIDHDVGAAESTVLDCGDRERVRLLFYERSSGRLAMGASRSSLPPKIVREALTCMDRAAK